MATKATKQSKVIEQLYGKTNPLAGAFEVERKSWYYLTDAQRLLDGSEEAYIAGESGDFTAAARGLCKSKWPKLYKEMDL